MRILMMFLMVVLVTCVAGMPAIAQEENVPQEESKKGDERKQTDEEDDLEALRRAAEAESKKEKETDDDAEKTIFKSGNLSLQALNPEISVTGDMLGIYQSGIDDLPSSRTEFRTLGIHFEAYLDPYSKFKAAVPISVVEAELGEAYFTRFGFLWHANITLGKFRQQFGVVNRWHKHALDWFDFPVALRSIFGPGGLNQVGLSLDWDTSTGPIVHGLVAQVTDARNPLVFGQNSDNRPSILGRYLAYMDLSASTYLQVGVTGMIGWNNSWQDSTGATADDSQDTRVYGADVVLMWEPTDRMRYRNVELRTEAYYLDKGILAPDGSGADRLKPWGLYSMVYAKLSRTVEVGVRYDYFSPDTKDYAALNPDVSLAPHATTQSDAHRQLAGAWLTWWQSPFVKFRIGYAYEDSKATGNDAHITTLQMVFAAGPHKHERY